MSAERLLLVEDDATTREVLTLLLEADGWSVLGVESGEAALDAVESMWPTRTRPGTILCDLHLPGVHGAALASALRRRCSEALLLAISASDPGEEGAAYDGWLRKPFDAADLRTGVAALVANHGTASFHHSRSRVHRERGDHSEIGTPVLAMEILLEIERQMGVRAKELYSFALADAGDRLSRMRRFVRMGDMAAFAAEAHALKGSAGMIGAKQLTTLAAEAEVLPADAAPMTYENKLQEMQLACDKIRLMLGTLFPA